MGNTDSKALVTEAETCMSTQQAKAATACFEEMVESGGKQTARPRRARKSTAPSSKTHTQQSRDDENVGTNKINDDQINVNLAMADLMAYLQVVANNSNHLPLTRRDDPQLEKMVTSLTAEEYARKSAAFVPADIRMIGGTFTRYGRVWDLPTNGEYNASDGALEPGRSYGGACCNTLLKVVYDAANDAAGTAQSRAAADSLFDDDEDDDDDDLDNDTQIFTKSVRSGFSLDYGVQNTISITWADLLRQMKAEFKEIGYAQVPRVTTTRKIDLNKPFSLCPNDFDPRSQKRSLLIGCNYSNMPDCELKASHDDVKSMKDYIVNVHNFPESDGLMTVLMDDSEHKPPTFMNIVEAFKVLSEESQPGDAVFVQFSGHGSRVLDSTPESETESYAEVIVPTDYKEAGLIRDTLMFKTLLAPMRFGVTVTILIDCCDNGMVLELPYSWSTRNDRKDSVAKLGMNDDFSFVRFLKVVKTLYESSTFTQLGKTVGSALGPLAAPLANPPSYEHSTKEANTSQDDDEGRTGDIIDRNGSTLFHALAQACSPSTQAQKDTQKSTELIELEDEKKEDISPEAESLFEKMINCTLISHPDDEEEDDEYSDEGTFKTRTYDDHSYGETLTEVGESFDSITDDESRRRSSRRRRRR